MWQKKHPAFSAVVCHAVVRKLLQRAHRSNNSAQKNESPTACAGQKNAAAQDFQAATLQEKSSQVRNHSNKVLRCVAGNVSLADACATQEPINQLRL